MKIIFSPETESNCISALLRHPEIFPDIDNFISENDFQSKFHRKIYGIIRAYLTEGQEANIILIASKIKSLGISFDNVQGEVLDVLESLQSVSQINHFVGLESFKELKKITVRREIGQTAENIQQAMYNAKNASIEQIVDMADKLYSGKISYFTSEGGDFGNIYDEMEQMIEDGDPIDEYGMMGPFKRVNQIYGSLVLPGNISVIGARTGVGKTSFGFYYLTHIQEQYGVPILHLDMGEMSKEELIYRACTMFTKGEVPLHHIQTRKYKRNAEMVRKVREVWPRIKGLKTTYENIAGKSREQVISLIRRFYLAKVGRGNKCLIHLDYLKPFEDSGSQEYQAMGHFIQDIKTLITTEVPAPLWTSLQLNRQGITTGKRASQIDDSENAFSISDRIAWQVSHAFLLRNKTPDELVIEPGLGNAKMIPIKYRHLGEDYKAALDMVKMPDGSSQKNYIHLKSENFTYSEVGDLQSVARRIKIPTKDGDIYDSVDL